MIRVGMEQAKHELPRHLLLRRCLTTARRVRMRLVIVTEWVQFRALDFARLKREMTSPVIVDLRNIYRRDEMEELGFVYESIGRGS